MKQNPTAYAALLALIVFLCGNAHADSVFLRGGEKLIGKVVSESSTNVIFESQTLGKLEIARDRIERIDRETPVLIAPVLNNRTPATAQTGSMLTNQFLPWLSGPFANEMFD